MCDNKCKHCIDLKYKGFNINKPDIDAIADTIIRSSPRCEDVLFLGGEPCFYLQELIDCIKKVKAWTTLKVYVTTSVPKICYDRFDLFQKLLSIVDGINLSVQHYKEETADKIRCTTSKYDRQDFYANLPHKDKIRINLNIVKPFLYTKADIIACLCHYDKMGFNEIKLSEIQHGKEYFVSFEKIFNIKLKSPFSGGCQTYIDMAKIVNGFQTPLLLKRSCFLCESTLKASVMDGIKTAYRIINKPKNTFNVIYENGFLATQWI
jgi:organic radical activating enzyme